MGILVKQPKENNVLTQNDFTYKARSVNGTLTACYEKFVPLSDTYDAFVAVKPETGEVSIYVEYECGGEVASFVIVLTASYSENPDEFFEELDNEVTELTAFYAD